MNSTIPPLEPTGHSSGLVVDQLALLGESRVNLGQPHEVANVNQWRVAIPRIEERTGLDFGAKVRGADTISDVQQPNVGEAAVRLAGLCDILAKRLAERLPA